MEGERERNGGREGVRNGRRDGGMEREHQCKWSVMNVSVSLEI